MNITKRSRQPGRRWLFVGAVGAALTLTPIGVMCATDYEAVEDRLHQAVGSQEITTEQADAMLVVLRKSEVGDDAVVPLDKAALHDEDAKKATLKAEGKDDAKSSAKDDEVALKEKYAAFKAELDEAVAAGKLSAEAAQAKLAHSKLELAGKTPVDEGASEVAPEKEG